MSDERRKTSDALRTYRYLRIGMISAVVLLAISVGKQGADQSCYQTSISGFFYTPVKSVLVGVLIAIGFAMIVIKGKNTFEDIALNFAGMFAPIVALAPTTPPTQTAQQACAAVVPSAHDLTAAIDNNVWALLLTGVACLAVGFVLAVVLNRNVTAPFTRVDLGTWLMLAAAFVAVAAAIALKLWWHDFDTGAHGKAAFLMFVCMFLAALAAAVEARHASRWFFGCYVATAIGMAGGVLLPAIGVGRHTVLWLEANEIFWFGFFWAVQTAERWNEPPAGSATTIPAASP